MKTEAADYFYTTANGRSGPVGFDELRALANSGTITRRDKVWCEGMPEWQGAASIPKLFDGLPPDLQADRPHTEPPPLAEPVDEPNRTETRSPALPPDLQGTQAHHKHRSPGLMAVASFLLPGLGQMLCGQDAKGLIFLILGIAAHVLSGGVTSLLLCPLMSWDAYGITQKHNGCGRIEKWEFFPQFPRMNALPPIAVPAGIGLAMILIVIVDQLAEANRYQAERDAQVLGVFKDLNAAARSSGWRPSR